MSLSSLIKKSTLVLIVLATISTIGCGSGGPKKPADMPKLSPCEFTITKGGSPIENALVTIVPLSGETKWQGNGVSDATGLVKIVTYGNFPGAPDGKYKVVVQTSEPPAPNPMESDEPAPADAGSSSVMVDKKYFSDKTSPLDLEVSASGANPATFELE